MEFLAYRILYMVHTRNRSGERVVRLHRHQLIIVSDFNSLLATLTDEQREDDSVKHALAVRTAVARSNYRQFFRLFLDAPKMGPYMMDHFLDRERVNALLVITKAWAPMRLESLIQAEFARQI